MQIQLLTELLAFTGILPWKGGRYCQDHFFFVPSTSPTQSGFSNFPDSKIAQVPLNRSGKRMF